ncbi:fibronectin type III domain-containing protein [Streptomyces boninensis]|uniref:fibronectin type III domain-containing protein n=1 Tax=Streptomyces boninensis TaxID=2039455 RepID=UPI003B2177FB
MTLTVAFLAVSLAAGMTAPAVAAEDREPPQTPTAPTFVDRTGRSVTMEWAFWDVTTPPDNVGVEDFLVSNGETTKVVPEGVAWGTVFTGLEPATSYSFTVRARDAAGNVSAPSPASTITTGVEPDTEPPTPVTRIQPEDVADGAHYVWWGGATDNVNFERGLRYRITTDGGTDHVVSRSFYADHPNIGDPLLTGCTITVRAIDSSGNVSAPRSANFC